MPAPALTEVRGAAPTFLSLRHLVDHFAQSPAGVRVAGGSPDRGGRDEQQLLRSVTRDSPTLCRLHKPKRTRDGLNHLVFGNHHVGGAGRHCLHLPALKINADLRRSWFRTLRVVRGTSS